MSHLTQVTLQIKDPIIKQQYEKCHERRNTYPLIFLNVIGLFRAIIISVMYGLKSLDLTFLNYPYIIRIWFIFCL